MLDPRLPSSSDHRPSQWALALLVAGWLAFAGSASAATVFINEIHYDNTGADTGEAIEVAGPAGTNLAGWSLVLYNGSGGAPYATINLAGSLPNQQSGFGTLSFAAVGLQNGSPDGIALVDGASTVVQFLSYEGTFTAVGGPANGQFSVDIGVTENGSGPVGDSLQLVGSGTTSADFTWATTQPNTFGAVNSGQTFAGGPVVTPVLNEFVFNHVGADTAEFVEVFGAPSTNYSTYRILQIEGDGATQGTIDSVTAVGTTDAGGFWTTTFLANAFENGSVTLLLVRDFTGAVGNDVDTNNDGLLETAFWSAIVDSVAVFDGTAGDGLYAPAILGPGFGGDPNTPGGASRIPNGNDTGAAGDWLRNDFDGAGLPGFTGSPSFGEAFNTPGAVNSAVPQPPPPVLEIYEIQGAGAASPFVGGVVTTNDNIVTALAADGFFLQTPDARADASLDTSNAVFVFTGAAPAVAVGDQVDVTGRVVEFFGLTELGNSPAVTVDSSGNALPAIVSFDSSVPSPDPTAPSCAIEYECYENMLIAVADGTVGGPNQRFNTDPIAEVHVVAGTARAFREPGVEFPGLLGLPVWDGNPEVFELDPDRLGLPNQIIPAGSRFSAVGVLGFEFNGYELWPTSLTVSSVPDLPRPVSPRQADELTVGTLNMFRFFDDIDDPPSVNFQGGVRNDTGEVFSSAVFLTRRTKFAHYILEVLLAPDILAVEEAEKIETLQILAADIAALDPSVQYTAYLVEGNDVGNIDTGFLVRDTVAVNAVEQLGLTETYINPLNGLPELLHDRPPLLLEGRYTGGGADFPLTVIAVHNRSLGSIEDPVQGPRVREKRLAQAQSIAQKVQDLQTLDPAIHLVVTGDFNAYEFSDGFVDAVGQIAGNFNPADNERSGPDLVDPNLSIQTLTVPADDRYSFVFSGSAQAIDHALTSAALTTKVRRFEYARGNADSAGDLVNDASTPLRSSDHDGAVLFLFADSDGDGVADSGDVCGGTVFPEAVPTQGLNPNHYALVNGDRIFDTVRPPGGGAGDVFTLDDTAGCSCDQIITALHLGNGHRKHGCSVGVMRDWVASVSP